MKMKDFFLPKVWAKNVGCALYMAKYSSSSIEPSS